MVSGQTTLYQKVSGPVPVGAVKVCAMLLSPLVGDVLPTIAADVPEWDVVTIDLAPAPVQQLKLPVSNPPFTTPGPPAQFTVSVTVVLWVADVPVPVTVIV